MTTVTKRRASKAVTPAVKWDVHVDPPEEMNALNQTTGKWVKKMGSRVRYRKFGSRGRFESFVCIGIVPADHQALVDAHVKLLEGKS